MVLIIVSFYSDTRGLLFTGTLCNSPHSESQGIGDLFRTPTAVLEHMIILNFMQLVLKIVSKFSVCERKTSEFGADIPERLRKQGAKNHRLLSVVT